jgi:hypothetical protein
LINTYSIRSFRGMKWDPFLPAILMWTEGYKVLSHSQMGNMMEI